uniref:Post-GPI attachment to proteins factor 3 n=1 Tax=Brassica oleracea var. oleracea TaxID=109376 RepID=A0A0D3D3M7_BRAOL
MVNSWEPLYSGVHRDQSKNKSDYGWYTTKFKIDDGDLKNKGGKPTVRVSNVGHALHRCISMAGSPSSLHYTISCLSNKIGRVTMNMDVDITKRLDYSSAIAVLGFSLIVSILRTFDVRVEAARAMVSAPVLALVTTHVLYINFYKLDYGIQRTLSLI